MLDGQLNVYGTWVIAAENSLHTTLPKVLAILQILALSSINSIGSSSCRLLLAGKARNMHCSAHRMHRLLSPLCLCITTQRLHHQLPRCHMQGLPQKRETEMKCPEGPEDLSSHHSRSAHSCRAHLPNHRCWRDASSIQPHHGCFHHHQPPADATEWPSADSLRSRPSGETRRAKQCETDLVQKM